MLPSQTPSGLQVAQSSDATCYGGLNSPTDGFQTFEFSNVRKSSALEFPDWTLDRLVSFDFLKLYEFNRDHTVLTISNYTYTDQEARNISRVTVMEVLDTARARVKMVTRTLTECEQVYTCTTLHRRTDHILELEEGLGTRVLRAACADTNYNARQNRFTVLVEEQLSGGSVACPELGVHNVTSLRLGSRTQLCEHDLKAFNRLKIGCSSAEHVQFIRECSGMHLSVIQLEFDYTNFIVLSLSEVSAPLLIIDRCVWSRVQHR